MMGWRDLLDKAIELAGRLHVGQMRSRMVLLRDAGVIDSAVANEWHIAAMDLHTSITVLFPTPAGFAAAGDAAGLAMTCLRLKHAAEDEEAEEARAMRGDAA